MTIPKVSPPSSTSTCSTRINRELDGDIPVDAFRHEARWNDILSRIEMHLVATRDVRFTVSGTEFTFARGSSIHIENSHKYGPRGGRVLLLAGGWTPIAEWSDPAGDFAEILSRRRAGEVCALTTARLSRRMLIALVDIADLLLSILTWIIIAQVVLSWLFVFNVLNTSSQGVRSIRRGDRSADRAALSADPAHAAGLRRDRFLAARHADPDPGDQEAARRRRRAILRGRMTARLIDGKAFAAGLRTARRRRCRSGSRPSRTRARTRRRSGRRASAERRLCPIEGQGDDRSGNGELRAPRAGDVTQGELMALVDRAQCRRRSTEFWSSFRCRSTSTSRR